jgi:hypothetical protein
VTFSVGDCLPEWNGGRCRQESEIS